MDSQNVHSKGITRRGFVSGATGMAGIAALGAVASSAAAADAQDIEWAAEAEAVVVGMGFAGLAAAIESANQGMSVIIVDKAPEEYVGGNSRVCGQAMWCSHDLEQGTQYFKTLAGEEFLTDIPDAVIEAYLTHNATNPEWVEDNADVEMAYNQSIEYPASGYAEDNERATNKNGKGNGSVWTPLYESLLENEAVEVRYATPFTDLVCGENGEVIGIEVLADGQPAYSKAERGVVLCCGGFEYNPTLIRRYLRNCDYASGSPFNTGDGHEICSKYDIKFWHMNSATQADELAVRIPWAEEDFAACAVPYDMNVGNFIWTDKYGKRFVEEATTSKHGHRIIDAIFYDDCLKMETPRLPLWQIFDENAFTPSGYGVTITRWYAQVGGFEYSPNMEKEIEAGLVAKCDTVEELAETMGIEAEVIAKTLEDWNSYVEAGEDLEFGRSVDSMGTINAPYYAMRVYPSMINTNGGPARNENGNIVHVDGTPVERLYGAGEFGSMWSNYYQGGGNVAECLSFGRIAAESMARQSNWDEA